MLTMQKDMSQPSPWVLPWDQSKWLPAEETNLFWHFLNSLNFLASWTSWIIVLFFDFFDNDHDQMQPAAADLPIFPNQLILPLCKCIAQATAKYMHRTEDGLACRAYLDQWQSQEPVKSSNITEEDNRRASFAASSIWAKIIFM